MQPTLDLAKRQLDKPLANYINGEWQIGQGNAFTLVNPSNKAVLTEYPMASQNDINHAVHAALTVHQNKTWVNTPMRARARLMRQIGELIREHQAALATLEALHNGKTFTEAYADDLPDSADIFDYYAGWIDKHYGETSPVNEGFLNYTLKEPIGVCAQIVPWNFPLLMACWKLAPAIAMGNPVVIKPSEFTPLSLIYLFELIDQHIQLPRGLLNLVLGDGRVGKALSDHPDVAKIAFTGSTQTGKAIVQAAGQSNLKHVTLELGGKSPNLFFEDTPDLPAALARSFAVMFSHKGEKCSEPTRFLIHENIYEQAVESLVSQANDIVLGEQFSENITQGAQCHQAHYDKVVGYIQAGLDEGATLAAGGLANLRDDGLFVPPTIFTDVKPQMKIAREEIFGPVLSILKFSSDEEAVALANDNDYGLAAGLYTKDITRAHRIAEQLDAGMIFINQYGCYEFSSPFGGFKQSGWGKEMGIHSLDAYTKTKSVWVKY